MHIEWHALYDVSLSMWFPGLVGVAFIDLQVPAAPFTCPALITPYSLVAAPDGLLDEWRVYVSLDSDASQLEAQQRAYIYGLDRIRCISASPLSGRLELRRQHPHLFLVLHPPQMLANALTRIYFGLQDFVVGQLRTAYILVWDAMLQFGNVLTFKRRPGYVIQEGRLGHGGLWPPFEPPRKSDSRSPCPALNAMANHGILPRSGRGIAIKSLMTTIPDTYNFSKSFTYFTLNYMAEMLQKSYAYDTFDLDDLAVHNGIAHDASLTRHDVPRQTDQSVPDQDLVDELLACATGKDAQGHALLTVADLARFSADRREHSRDTNGQFTMSFLHKMFSSSNTTTLLTVFGGRVDDLAVILKEERIPDGWEPRVRGRNGLTIAGLNTTVLRLELSIPEHRGPRKIRLA